MKAREWLTGDTLKPSTTLGGVVTFIDISPAWRYTPFGSVTVLLIRYPKSEDRLSNEGDTLSKLVTLATFEHTASELKSGNVQFPVWQEGVVAEMDSLAGLNRPILTACCMLRLGTPSEISIEVA